MAPGVGNVVARVMVLMLVALGVLIVLMQMGLGIVRVMVLMQAALGILIVMMHVGLRVLRVMVVMKGMMTRRVVGKRPTTTASSVSKSRSSRLTHRELTQPVIATTLGWRLQNGMQIV
jgi:hypothetical protein